MVRYIKRIRRRPRRYFHKKRNWKRRNPNSTLGGVGRSIRPAIHSFKRSFEQTISLSTSAVPEGWYANGNNLYKNWGFSLASIGNFTHFTDLFKFYKVNAARVQMYFSNTGSVPTMGDNMYYPNAQIMLHIDTNRDGHDTSESGLEQTYLNSQTAKKKLCLNSNGKPVDIYMPLRQASQMYGGPANTDYATVRPRWISTTEPLTPHFGFKTMLQRVDGQAFQSITTNTQYVKIQTTLYFQCKKVE